MSEQTTLEAEDEYDPPAYSTPGRILLRTIGPSRFYRIQTEVLDYEPDTSVYWINEGVGFDYWLGDVEEITQPGIYVIEGVTGEYIRGDGWEIDDDEVWDYTSVRPATEEEISAEALA